VLPLSAGKTERSDMKQPCRTAATTATPGDLSPRVLTMSDADLHRSPSRCEKHGAGPLPPPVQPNSVPPAPSPPAGELGLRTLRARGAHSPSSPPPPLRGMGSPRRAVTAVLQPTANAMSAAALASMRGRQVLVHSPPHPKVIAVATDRVRVRVASPHPSCHAPGHASPLPPPQTAAVATPRFRGPFVTAAGASSPRATSPQAQRMVRSPSPPFLKTGLQVRALVQSESGLVGPAISWATPDRAAGLTKLRGYA